MAAVGAAAGNGGAAHNGVADMGASDLRDAFNAVAAPRFTCTQAFMDYAGSDHGVPAGQFQILKFSGRTDAGNGFEVQSAPLAPETDVNAAAREVAQKLLDNPPAQ